MNRSPTLAQLDALARQAGAAIMDVYAQDFQPQFKADQSPLTQADLAAHRIICNGLAQLDPDTPILSEEGEQPDFSVRKDWPRYWLIDPLDGTKEFVKRNGEFTVNIALIEDGRAHQAVVHAPTLDISYRGELGLGASSHDRVGNTQSLNTQALGACWRVLLSRSHPDTQLDTLLKQLPKHEPIRAGSSLKFCRLAEGLADFYPRFGPTSEWDTAAGQCVLEAAGGAVLKRDGTALDYNQKADILNPAFFAVGQPDYDWQKLWESAP